MKAELAVGLYMAIVFSVPFYIMLHAMLPEVFR